jgi:acetylornithine/LysW-gamma-L-lysine aminotransferase
MTNAKELQHQYELEVYPKRELTIVKGKNAKVWDDRGEEYIDCAAGIGVANVGHCNDKVVNAISRQAETLITLPGIFYNDKRAELLKKLVNVSPESITRAFLCNSGTEAMEAALKFTRLNTGKTDFICAEKGFHGRTMGSLSGTFKEEYRSGFGPLIEGFSFVPYNNFEKLEAAVTGKTAGIILELVQGEGGINIADKEYISSVRKLCDEKNIMFIADEIQTGFCRTGKFFASGHYNLNPDLMTVAKGIAGGFPVGAVLCSDKISMPVGKHGTTFGGNPLACAAAIAAIDFMIENKLDEQAEAKGKYFKAGLKQEELSKVKEIRNLGLMIGIELNEPVKPYLQQLMEKKILALPAGLTVIRLLPPLTISNEELNIVAENLIEVLK